MYALIAKLAGAGILLAAIAGGVLYYGHTRFKSGEAKLQPVVTQQKATIADLRGAAKTNIDSLNTCVAQNKADEAKYQRAMRAQADIVKAEQQYSSKVARELASLKATAPATKAWADERIPESVRKKGAELVR